MIDEGTIGMHEAVWLITITISAKVFFTSPATVMQLVGAAGWYMTLVAAALALLGFLCIYQLLKRFPGKDLVDIYEIALSRPLGSVFSCITGVYALAIAFIRLAEFTQTMRVYVLPLSPNWYIIGFFVLAIFVLAKLGVESIARLSVLLVYPMLVGYTLVIMLGSQNYRLYNLYPILGHGLKATVWNGFVRSSVYGEIIVLAVFAKSFQGAQYIKREGLISLGLSALILSSSLLFFSLSFPYHIGREIIAPMYEMAALINYGQTLQRVEPVFLLIWIISSLISTATMFYSFVWIFCKTFRIPDKNPIVLGGSVLVFAASLMHRDMVSIIVGAVELIRKIGSLIFFVMPLIALTAALIRKKGTEANA